MARLAILLFAVALLSGSATARLLQQNGLVPTSGTENVTSPSPAAANAGAAAAPSPSPEGGAAAPSPAPEGGAAAGNSSSAGGGAAGNTTAAGGGAGNTTAGGASYPTFAEALQAANTTGNLSILVQAVEAAGLTNSINDTTAWTILAPTDAAFQAALTKLNLTAAQLLDPNNTQLLTAILSYHVIPAGALTAANLTDGQNLTTALASAGNLTVSMPPGGNVTFTGANGTNASVVAPDIKAGASIIHVIDGVLVPPADATAPAAGGDMTAGGGAAGGNMTAGGAAGGNMTSELPGAGAAGAGGMEASPSPAGGMEASPSPAAGAGGAGMEASPAPASGNTTSA